MRGFVISRCAVTRCINKQDKAFPRLRNGVTTNDASVETRAACRWATLAPVFGDTDTNNTFITKTMGDTNSRINNRYVNAHL